MAKSISQFFSDFGFPLRNVRWSWGAHAGDTVVLRTWDDEFSLKGRTVRVLREPSARQMSESYGLDERISHLKQLWGGGLAGYTVIAMVKDPGASPREIKDFRDDVVFPILRLAPQADGSMRAELGQPVPVKKLETHALIHRTEAGDGPFPAEGQGSGVSTETYQQKLPAMRLWLIEVAQAKSTVTYSDVMNRFGMTFYPLRNAMSRLGKDAVAASEPVITALIVDKETGRCSDGLFDEFGIDDDQAERERLYAFWGEAGEPLPPTAKEPAPSATPAEDFEAMVVRFTKAAVRPEQAPFRQAVFRRFQGRCVVTGCSAPEALEAAHLLGRDWRQGHNDASDGLLLRRDIHALYDKGLVKIAEDLRVEVDPAVASDYGQYASQERTGPDG